MTTPIEVISYARESALQGRLLDRDKIIALLEIDPDSSLADTLGKAAREVAAEITGNFGRVWASIGVDYAPCPVNCHFCSFGEQWGVLQEEYRWSATEIVDLAKKFLYGGAKWITLRTTEYYSLSELTALAKQIRKTIPGDYGIDVFLTAMEYGASLTGAMARVPVPGTPLGHIPAVSERRLAQVAAVTRLAAGRKAPDICIHPASQLALEWGANVVVVEAGAIPRDTGNSKKEWNSFDLETAADWFRQAGYKE